MKLEKKNKEKIGFITWIIIWATMLLMIIAIVVCLIDIPLRFAIPRDVQNAVSMNPILTKMVYNEHTEKLTITGKNKKGKFKLHKEDWDSLEKALTKREKKDWTGWTFEEEVVIGGKDYAEKYIIYTGTRKLKQEH